MSFMQDCHKAELMYATAQYSSLIFQDEVLTHYWKDLLGKKKTLINIKASSKNTLGLLSHLLPEGDLQSFSIRKAIFFFFFFLRIKSVFIHWYSPTLMHCIQILPTITVHFLWQTASSLLPHYCLF